MKKKIFLLCLFITFAINVKAQFDDIITDDISEIGKINLELAHIEQKADSIQIHGIIDMLLDEKHKFELVEKILEYFDKDSQDYKDIEKANNINKLKYLYLVNTVDQRYYDDVLFHISEFNSKEQFESYRNLVISNRKLKILEKYKKLIYDYSDKKLNELNQRFLEYFQFDQ